MARTLTVQDIEPLPEADRLEGFPHPRATKWLFGHSGAQQSLTAAFDRGRMHHAWLFSGREGIGKATLAYRLARYTLARREERDAKGGSLDIPSSSIAARQVAALSHPGLLLIRRPYDAKNKRFTTAITVDEVRRIKSFLARTAEADAWRVVIVDQADELNINAANALLKSLEEPPPRALFLLISSEPGGLLPTIRSRCRALDLEPLSPEDLKRAVEAAAAAAEVAPPNQEDWQRLVLLAEGSVRRALVLAGTGGVRLYEHIVAIIGALPHVDWSAIYALADELTAANSEQKFEAFYDLLLGLAARLARAAATGIGSADDLELAKRLIPVTRLPFWAEAWQRTIIDKADVLALNLDRKALILSTIARFEVVCRSS
jgi:DNA polymerase III subunit delta'